MKVLALLVVVAAPLFAQPGGNELFEKEIRPVFVKQCYGCHSSTLKTPMGGLVLDTKAGVLKGGNGGAVIVPGNPAGSRLMRALNYTDTQLRMPPTGKLTER